MSFKQLQDILSNHESVVFVGLGNPFCGDDRAGLLLLDALPKKIDCKQAQFISAGCNPENHLMQIIAAKPDIVVFVDAAENSGKADRITLYNSEDLEKKDFSTHAYSIAFIEKFIKMAIETDFIYLGINIKTTRPGDPLSDDIVTQINNYFK